MKRSLGPAMRVAGRLLFAVLLSLAIAIAGCRWVPTGNIPPEPSSSSPPDLRGQFTFVDLQGQPAVYSIDAGRVIWSATDAISPATWSPQGDRVVYLKQPGGASVLMEVVDVDGSFSEDYDLTRPEGFVETAYGQCWWSPSGDYVAVLSSGVVEVIDLKHTKTSYSATWIGQVLWSATVDTLYFGQLREFGDSTTMDIMSVDFCRDAKVTPYLTASQGQRLTPLGWTSSGAMAFVDTTGSEESPLAVVRDSAGGRYEQWPMPQTHSVSAGIGIVDRLSRASGADIWLIEATASSGQSFIWLHDSARDKLWKLVEGYYPSWRPGSDGR